MHRRTRLAAGPCRLHVAVTDRLTDPACLPTCRRSPPFQASTLQQHNATLEEKLASVLLTLKNRPAAPSAYYPSNLGQGTIRVRTTDFSPSWPSLTHTSEGLTGGVMGPAGLCV